MPGFGIGDHQVARHPVAVHRDRRLRQRAGHQQVAQRRPTWRCSALAPRDAELALHAPVGEQRSSRRSSASSYGGSASPGTVRCHCTSAAIASRIRRSACAGSACASPAALEVQRAAEVAQQQEALRLVGGEHVRRMQAGGLDRAGDVDERPHVFLRRRRVHHDEAAPASTIDAEVAPEARVGRCRPRLAASSAWRAPAAPASVEGGCAVRVGPGDPGAARRAMKSSAVGERHEG